MIVPSRQSSLPHSPSLGHHHLQLPRPDGPVQGSGALGQDGVQHLTWLRGEEGDTGESPDPGTGHLVERSRHLAIGGEVETPAGQQEAPVLGDINHLPRQLHLQAGYVVLLDEGHQAEVSQREYRDGD